MLDRLKPFTGIVLRPIAAGLARLGVTPNALTIASIVPFVIAAWFTARGMWFAALIFVAAGSLMDLLDGLLAREANLKSTFGAVLDSTCDRISETIWFVGLLVYYVRSPAAHWGIYLCFGAITGSLMVSYVKARCEGAGVECATGLLQRPERIVIIMFCLLCGATVMIYGLAVMTVMTYVTVIQRLCVAQGKAETNRQ